MAAFFGEGIDNALVEIDSSEVPILDGSAKNYVEKIKEIHEDLYYCVSLILIMLCHIGHSHPLESKLFFHYKII